MSLPVRPPLEKPVGARDGGETLRLDLARGVAYGLLGMLGFSGTLVATRLAVADLSPLDITSGRIVVAALLAAAVLAATGRLKLPETRLIPSLLTMGAGLAVGFPLCLALALKEVPAVHGAVVTGLAPAATAVIAVFRAGERMPLGFWIACLIGFAAILAFAIDAGGGGLSLADAWLLLAMLSLGIAYVEGGRASLGLGGTVALCWAMLLLAPAAMVAFVVSLQDLALAEVAPRSWAAFLYVGSVSMFLASVLWYRGLAAGGIARIGQINLLMPLLAMVWAWLILGEPITATAIATALIVLCATVFCLSSRTRVQRTSER